MLEHIAIKALAASFLLVALPGCQPGGDVAPPRTADSPAPTTGTPADAATQGAPTSSGVTLMVAQGSPSYITDRAGSSVYFLHGNRDGSKCDAACQEAWPPVLSRTRPVAGNGIRNNLLDALPLSNGTLHVAYAGQPLYRYSADSGGGRTAGHGVQDKWGEWSLIREDGKRFTASQ